VLRRALDDAVRRGLLVTNPAAVARAPNGDPSPVPHSERGMPSNCGRFSTPAQSIGSTPRCGCPPTRAYDAASCSASAGATSSSAPRGCQ
jgi:hypothetical protein